MCQQRTFSSVSFSEKFFLRHKAKHLIKERERQRKRDRKKERKGDKKEKRKERERGTRDSKKFLNEGVSFMVVDRETEAQGKY